MTGLIERILDRLKKLEFEVRQGSVLPFGERLPLVSATAWDTKTAQLALFAEATGTIDQARWRQLLFAGSGIRHQLAADHASGFGTPVVFAVVDSDGAAALRELAEDLAKRYAVFNRVDLNLIPQEWVGVPGKLDDALAPLLPRCRDLLGEEISRKEVQKFWEVLRDRVVATAEKLPESFGATRRPVGEASAEELIGDSANMQQLPAPKPIRSISMRNFRSIREASFSLADVNILHGPNGGGKTTAVEAMELGWAESSQRMPGDVKAEDYARHLPWNGEGTFTVTVDDREVTALGERPKTELARCVLTQDVIANLVDQAPQQRFTAMLAVTGLEIPDLKARTKRLVETAKLRADAALAEAGLPPLPTSASNGLGYLTGKLEGNFLSRISTLPELQSLETTISSLAQEPFQISDPNEDAKLRALLENADAGVAEGLSDPAAGKTVATILDEAGKAVERLLASRLQRASAVRQVLSALEPSQPLRDRDPAPDRPEETSDAPISTRVAVKWMNHSRSLLSAAEEFEGLAAGTEDAKMANRLKNYAKALVEAAEIAPPMRALERWSRPQARLAPPPASPGIPSSAPYGAAGFAEVPESPAAVQEPLRELVDVLQKHIEVLRQLDDDLRSHPARNFGAHSARVMDALCRFELARTLRREGPIQESSEALVADLMDQRLGPVVIELTAAIVRFEWYFKPLQLSSEKGKVVLAGLATDSDELDARMLLNSGERSLVGLAWFLALHMLQPRDRREVLVLDDPASGLDAMNQAGLASTMRAFVRLLKPRQVVLATHDDAVAAVFAEEFALPGKWPKSIQRLRFRRGGDDCTKISEELVPKKAADLSDETERLGLLADATTE